MWDFGGFELSSDVVIDLNGEWIRECNLHYFKKKKYTKSIKY